MWTRAHVRIAIDKSTIAELWTEWRWKGMNKYTENVCVLITNKSILHFKCYEFYFYGFSSLRTYSPQIIDVGDWFLHKRRSSFTVILFVPEDWFGVELQIVYPYFETVTERHREGSRPQGSGLLTVPWRTTWLLLTVEVSNRKTLLYGAPAAYVELLI